jgi:hypothetical protein
MIPDRSVDTTLPPAAADAAQRPGYRLAAGLFLRGLGLSYAIAFASFGVQARGLVGERGILPVVDLLRLASERLGSRAPLELPSLLWLRSDDTALLAVCAAGCGLGVALLLGRWPRAAAAGAGLLYLSLVSVGGVFLGYQWDALLLEAGLLAVWLAPPGRRAPLAATPQPARAPLFLLRWLLFRLFLLSGLVKLLSGDPSWRDFTAMTFHYWTQPLPNRLSPFFYALPTAVHRVETGATLAIELGLPWFVFAPAPARRAAGIGFLGLLLLINATGNYGFFGLIAGSLCLLTLDDALLSRLPGLRRALVPVPAPGRPRPLLARAVTAAAVALVLVLTTSAALRRIAPGILPPGWAQLVEAAGPLESFNAYGLFAVMTKDRLEIDVEGRAQSGEWRAYDFRFKPDRVIEAPPFAGPWMPRLDWQMWFAALGQCASTPWFLEFQRRLLEADPAVLGLLAGDPLHGARPRAVRSTLYRYRFADCATRRRTGDWWVRERLGPYCPPLVLIDGRLAIGDGG